jgi:NAD(P)H-dependent flavin oxidoreductase YrpB (nitropropane dioxygenase family)
LAAAVTNAGGLGVLGGVGYTPAFLRRQIAELKVKLTKEKEEEKEKGKEKWAHIHIHMGALECCVHPRNT